MAEFRIVSRGEGLLAWMSAGYFSPSYIADLLDRTPEAMLDPEDLARLRMFLSDEAPQDRWTVSRRAEGQELACLVGASTSDSMIDEAKALLCAYLCGSPMRGRGRPAKLPSRNRQDMFLLAKIVKDHAEICIREGRPVVIPAIGPVYDDPSWIEFAPSEHAMHIAQRCLQDRGYNPLSLGTLRNGLPKFSTLGILS